MLCTRDAILHFDRLDGVLADRYTTDSHSGFTEFTNAKEKSSRLEENIPPSESADRTGLDQLYNFYGKTGVFVSLTAGVAALPGRRDMRCGWKSWLHTALH